MLWIDLDHLCFDGIATRDDIFDLAKRLVGKLCDMDEPLNAIFKLHKGAKSGDFADCTFDKRANGQFLLNAFPWVLAQLLYSKCDFFVFFIDSEHDGFDEVTLFEDFRRM